MEKADKLKTASNSIILTHSIVFWFYPSIGEILIIDDIEWANYYILESVDMKFEFGKEQDIEKWMNLVNKVKSSFPGLETKEALDEHRQTVLNFMSTASAICAKTDNQIVGVLLFSREENMLCFLAVDEKYRRQHIAERMVAYMLSCMDPEKKVTVTTYREGTPEGIAARAFYKRLGFVEGALTEEFGSPAQEFVLSL